MNHRITLIHSIYSIIDNLIKELSLNLPETDFINLLDESLLHEFKVAEGLNTRAFQKVYRMVETAAESDSELILFSCSSISPMAPLLKPFFSIPILTIDENLFCEAVKKADNLVVFGTAMSALNASRQGLEKANIDENRNTKIEIIICSIKGVHKSKLDFYKHVAKEIEQKYNQIGSVDTILLAQLSMIPAIDYLSEGVKNKVLPTIPFAIKHVKRELEKIKSKHTINK